uniref:Uncharacterized protein n=1 Tax=Panagrolaimus davidi TaxID=227884 RepID=A0A914PA37_9BILA
MKIFFHQSLNRCDVKRLFLSYQIISIDNLSLIISSSEWIDFIDVVVRHADSSNVPLEDIVAIAVNAKSIDDTGPTITANTMKKLTKLSHFFKLDDFTLYNVSEVFDIDAFYSYMKKNQWCTKCILEFDEQISDAFKNKLKTIVDEILETQQFNYKPPVINFIGLDSQKYENLRQIYFSH